MRENQRYDMSGNFFELCDCSNVCPCWLDEMPDSGSCAGVFAWAITEGTVKDVDVAGTRVASVSFHTGMRGAGVQQVFLFVDDEASDQQAEVLADAFTGALGGPLEELSEMMGELKGTARRSIEIKSDDRAVSLTVGNSIAGTAEVLVGPHGEPTVLSHSPASRMLPARAELGRSDFRIGLGIQGFDVEVNGRAAMRGRFRYAN